MRNFIYGLIAGTSISAASVAYAAELVHGSGYLFGWDVMINGEIACSDPFVWPAFREIECD